MAEIAAAPALPRLASAALISEFVLMVETRPPPLLLLLAVQALFVVGDAAETTVTSTLIGASIFCTT